MANTSKMLRHYELNAKPSLFLSNFFKVTSESFFETSEVEYDIIRSGEDIARVVGGGKGENFIDAKIFTNKKITPPTIDEAVMIGSDKLDQRIPGQAASDDISYQQKIVSLASREVAHLEPRLRRLIEVQASQVLQLGVITLWNDVGVADFTLDFQPKATHLPAVAVAWDQAAAVIAEDLNSLCDVVRTDGLLDPDTALFGDLAFETAMKNADFRARFEPRRASLGEISGMAQRPDGGQFRGTIDLGTYKLNVFTYGGRYNLPTNGASTKFLDPRKVTVLNEGADLRALFGKVGNVRQELGMDASGPLLRRFSGRVSSESARIDMTRNAWFSPSGKDLVVAYGSKPLLVPCAIDTIGTLSTGIA